MESKDINDLSDSFSIREKFFSYQRAEMISHHFRALVWCAGLAGVGARN